MRVLINGLGCTVTGSRVVLDEIIKSVPPEVILTAIVPIVDGAPEFNYPPAVKLIKLKHSVWGMYLRPLVELLVNIFMIFRQFDLVVNLSSYGFCFTRRQVLYIHNPMILDMHAEKKMGRGNANKLVRMALNTFLRSGEHIFVQTEHMYAQLVDYCNVNKIDFPAAASILKPPFPSVDIATGGASRKFSFQFFYPVSPFPHKRGDLAIAAVNAAQEFIPGAGLVITLSGNNDQSTQYIGTVSLSEVHSQFKACDSLLFTSERETLGLPLLEAMYFEKPAVLPRKDYATEIYGDAGVYYDNDSPADIAAAIKRLHDNYKEYLQKTLTRKQHEQQFRLSWREHWDEFIKSIA